MACRFQCNDVAIDEPRLAFVITGVVVEGFVRNGMRVQFRSRDDSVSVAIDRVENAASGQSSELALTLLCTRKISLERLRIFHIRNQVLEITDQ